MDKLIPAIEKLRAKLPKLRRHSLKETPTRTIVIDPLLEAMGWDVRDPDEVQLEYPTVDGKSVDYALKINGHPVLLVEAKPLGDALTDVKAVTQVVGYAANDGIVWCVLTNGVKWKVYRSVEQCPAPEKLMFEVSLAPRESEGISIAQLAERLWRLSRDEMAKGTLDIEGERTFTDSKVRKALDAILTNPPRSVLNLVRKVADDSALTAHMVRESLGRIWAEASGMPVPTPSARVHAEPPCRRRSRSAKRRGRTTKGAGKRPEFGESHHTAGKPMEALEQYRAVDQFCLSLRPGQIERQFLKFSIRYTCDGRPFCWLHIQQGGIRVWLKLSYDRLEDAPPFARDVSSIGHWGGGDLELAITSPAQIEQSSRLIRESFERLCAPAS